MQILGRLIMKKNFKKAVVFMTCALVGGAALFASPAKETKTTGSVQAEYFPLLGVTVIETKDGKGNVSVEFKEGNHEYLSTVKTVAAEKTKPGCIHGVNCKDKKCSKPVVVIPEKPSKAEVKHHGTRPQPGAPGQLHGHKKDRHQPGRPDYRPQGHHKSEPKVRQPEHHKSEPQVRQPEHHKSEPKNGSAGKGPVALRITAQNDR